MPDRYTTRFLLFTALLAWMAVTLLPGSVFAQCADVTLVEDVENVDTGQIRANGWETFGTGISSSTVLNGQQSFLTSGANGDDPGDNRVIRTPYVNVTGEVCVEFAYQPISPGSNTFVRVVLLDREDGYYPLDEVDLSGVTTVETYQRTFTAAEVAAAAPNVDIARIGIEFNGDNAGGRRLVVDDVAVTEEARYDDGSDDYSNTPPTGIDDAYNAQLNLETTGNVLDNDFDADIQAGIADGPLFVRQISDVSNGSLVLDADGAFSYTPSATGTDSFTYEVCDNGYDVACSEPTTVTFSNALPVELAAFDATVEDASVVLQWRTLSETNNAGFSVERRTPDGFEAIGYVEGAGTTTEPQRYRHRVADLQPGTHAFRLKQVDLDGATAYSPTVTARLALDGALTLTGVAPNPVRDAATLRLGVTEAVPVTVTLYDLLGRELRTLFDGTPAAGRLVPVTLDASDLPSGRYLLRAVTGTHQATQTITVVR